MGCPHRWCTSLQAWAETSKNRACTAPVLQSDEVGQAASPGGLGVAQAHLVESVVSNF